VRLEVDGSVVRESMIPASQSRSNIFAIKNYYFSFPGAHTVCFTIDPEHKFSEADKTDNIFTKTINVAPADEAKDIEAKDIYVIPLGTSEPVNVVEANRPLLLFYSIFNKSDHKIHDVKVRVRETNASGDQMDWVNLKLPWIDARRMVTYCFELSWPDVGRHDLWLYVDSYNEISEMNEENNSKGIKVKVIPKKARQTPKIVSGARCDVIASDVQFIPKGQDAAVSETRVETLGTIHGKLSNVSDSVVNNIEFVTQVDGIDIDRNTINLKPGQIANCSVSGFFFDSPRAHVIKLIVDPDNNLAESNELNNAAKTEIYVKKR